MQGPDKSPQAESGSEPEAPQESAASPLDPQHLRDLAEIVQSADLSELYLEDRERGFKVRMRRGAATAAPMVSYLPGPGAVVPGAAPAGAAGAGTPAAERTDVDTIESPMVGTFYRAASPDSDPFSEVGQRINSESVICIIEAMKVMNEIKSEVSGEIVEILVENGEPVEFGQPLFLIKT